LKKPLTLIKDGVLNGLGYSMAVSAAHLAYGIVLIMATNMPPLTWFAFRSYLLEVPIGAVLGLLLCPLLLLPRGKWAHAAGLTVAWCAMEYSVTIDPNTIALWTAPSVIGLVLYAAGVWLNARKPGAGPVGGVALVGVILAVPLLRTAMVGGLATVDTSERPAAPAGAPDVVFVVLDTVRAKSMSAYGYERPTSPNFDAFAAEGALFTKAQAPATWSLPAHASLFTGHFPSSHNTHLEHRFLDDRLPTIAEAFQQEGYQTLAFTANTHISDSFGLTRGFDWTDQAWITGAGGRGFTFIYRLVDAMGYAAEDKGGGQVAKNVQDWMAKRGADDGPAFVFINFLEAHFPFHQLPDEFLWKFTEHSETELREASEVAFGAMFGRALTDEELHEIHSPIIDMYDSGVLYSDHLFGEVLKAYDGAGRLDDTIIVVLGDHGEMTGEHGGHGHAIGMYQENLHVPLAIRWPKGIEPGTTVDRVVSTAGVYPTLMELIGSEPLGPTQAKSLVSEIEGTATGPDWALSEHFEEDMLLRRYGDDVVDAMDPLITPRGRHRAFRLGDWKLVQTTARDTYLFDLDTDPAEERVLPGTHEEAQRLADELDLLAMGIAVPPLDADLEGGEIPELDPAAMEQLRALGYIE